MSQGIILLWLFTGEGAGAPSPVNIQKEDGPWLMVFQWGTYHTIPYQNVPSDVQRDMETTLRDFKGPWNYPFDMSKGGHTLGFCSN